MQQNPDYRLVPHWKSRVPRKGHYKDFTDEIIQLKMLGSVEFLETILAEFEYEANMTDIAQRPDVNPATARIRNLLHQVSPDPRARDSTGYCNLRDTEIFKDQ